MIKQIILYGNKILRQKSKDIEKIDDSIIALAKDLQDTLETEENGVGLAAPQIGVSKKMFILNLPSLDINNMIFINPEIIEKSEETDSLEEGCLSIPGIEAAVTRPFRIKLRAINLDGDEFECECDDFLARAIQHENDHLNAVLFIDKISPIKKAVLKKKLNKIKAIGLKQQS